LCSPGDEVASDTKIVMRSFDHIVILSAVGPVHFPVWLKHHQMVEEERLPKVVISMEK
jgi:hypothetical protein